MKIRRSTVAIILGFTFAISIVLTKTPMATPAPQFPAGTQAVAHHDYVAEFNAAASKNISDDDNAAVVLRPFMESYHAPPAASSSPATGPATAPQHAMLKSLAKFKQSHPEFKNAEESAPDFEKRLEIMDEQTYAPWQADKFPLIAAWLADQRDVIAAAMQAASKSKFLEPLVEKHPGKGMLDALASLRSLDDVSLGRMLIKQAMLDYGEHRSEIGLRELLAAHRLARLYSQEPFEITALEAAFLDRQASQAERRLLQSGLLGSAENQAITTELQHLPVFRPSPDIFSIGETYFALDEMQMLREGRGNDLMTLLFAPFQGKTEFDLRDLSHCDWKSMNGIARASMAEWDGIYRARDLQTRRTLIGAAQEPWKALEGPEAYMFRTDGKLKRDDISTVNEFLHQRPAESGAQYSERIGNWLMGCGDSSLPRQLAILDSTIAEADLTQVAFALERFHQKNQAYPEKLLQLQPDYLSQIPTDKLSEKPFNYHTVGDGYILYSVGINGIDDGGKDRANGGDDIVVKVRPKAKP